MELKNSWAITRLGARVRPYGKARRALPIVISRASGPTNVSTYGSSAALPREYLNIKYSLLYLWALGPQVL